MIVNMDILVLDKFRDVYLDILANRVHTAVLCGGRSSTKSQTIANAIVTGCMINKCSAVAILKYQNKIEDRLVNTFKESLRLLGVEDYWKLRRSPFELVLLDDNGKETDISIKFTGADDPTKLKSFKPRRGNFQYIWFEELENFASYEEVMSIIQTMRRGKGKSTVIMSYNPPMHASNWVNHHFTNNFDNVIYEKNGGIYKKYTLEINNMKEEIIEVIHKSTYLDVIAGCSIRGDDGKIYKVSRADWLGSGFIADAERMKEQNEKYYRWAYLGEVVGTDANVFSNVVDWDGCLDGIDCSTIYRGLDWGYGGPDPVAYVEWVYDRRNNSIYCINEFGRPKMSIEEVAYEIKRYNKHNFPVYADSAVPVLNTKLNQLGVSVIPAIKGPDSRLAGIKWLQGLSGIYIDKIKTPNTYMQFKSYEYTIDKNNQVTAEIPDGNDHWIDATRYAFSTVIKYL